MLIKTQKPGVPSTETPVNALAKTGRGRSRSAITRGEQQSGTESPKNKSARSSPLVIVVDEAAILTVNKSGLRQGSQRADRSWLQAL